MFNAEKALMEFRTEKKMTTNNNAKRRKNATRALMSNPVLRINVMNRQDNERMSEGAKRVITYSLREAAEENGAG